MLFCDHSFGNFLDAIMLFGASLEARNTRVVIRVGRRLDHRRPLAWVVALMLQHDIDTNLCETSDDNLTIYRSLPLMFGNCVRDRWYDPIGLHLPHDVEVNVPLLAMWTTDALSRSDPKSPTDDIRYKIPPIRSADPLVYDRMIREAIALDFPMRIDRDGRPFVQAKDKDQLAERIHPLVPRATWDQAYIVEPTKLVNGRVAKSVLENAEG